MRLASLQGTSVIKLRARPRSSAATQCPEFLLLPQATRASALFNEATATWALVSDPHWRQEIGSSSVNTAEDTDLEKSVFLKPGPNGTIVACRKSISAIVLVAVHGKQSDLWGIIHPEPAFPLNVEYLPGLPFVRIARWPVVDGRILTEWVVGSPRGRTVHHYPVDCRTAKPATFQKRTSAGTSFKVSTRIAATHRGHHGSMNGWRVRRGLNAGQRKAQ